MSVLITGGAGFIGSHVVDAIIEKGLKAVIIDDFSTGKERNINREATFYRLDIQDPKLDSVFKDERPEYVYHLAAQVDVRRSITDPILDARINVLGTINLLLNCVRHDVKKVVFASSGGAIYGEQEFFPAPETHSLKPVSPYGVAKLAAENYLHYFRNEFGLDFISLRYSNVYGPRQDPCGEAGVIAVFVQKMLQGEIPVINGDGEQTRDFIYVGDVVEANVLALSNNSEDKTFNIGTGIETSVNDVFHRLRELINPSLVEKHGAPLKGEQRRSVIECSKAREHLCWEPRTLLKDGLRRTCEYFKVLNR
jgi:UDP-glucose 4-epimerase